MDLMVPPLGEMLIAKFPAWVSYFETNGPFRKFGQLEYHRETIDRRFEIGSAAAAVKDDQFLKALYRTLQAWGIGSRRSRLKPFGEFAGIFERQAQVVGQFEAMTIDDPRLDTNATTNALWALLLQLPIVENAAILVSATKALHHVLPNLVVPMDREYTQIFFGWHNPKFQYDQRECFLEAFGVFAQVARTVNPSQFLNKSWNSSRSKVIDNAVVGLVRWVRDHVDLTATSDRS